MAFITMDKNITEVKAMTHEEWLKSLSREDLAEWLAKRLSCGACDLQDTCGYDRRSFEICREIMKNWLEAKKTEPIPTLEKGDVIELKDDMRVYVYLGNDVTVMADRGMQKLISGIENARIKSIKRYEISRGKYTCIWGTDNE